MSKGNSDNAHSWDDADVYVAPVGTTAPVDNVATWGVGWEAVGLVDGEQGLTQGRDQDTSDHYAWGGVLVRTVKSKHKRTFKFVCLEDNATTFGLVNPGSSSTASGGLTTRTVKAPSPDPRAFGFELVDGTDVKRIIVPKGEITDVGDIKSSEGDLEAYELTVTVYPASDGTIYTEILPTPA